MVTSEDLRLKEFKYLREELLEKREYQLSIAEQCVNKNSLVIIPTGLGKTIIALLVAAKTLEYYPPDSKIILMAPTRPLIDQHHEFFLRFLNIPPEKFVILTGRTSPKERPLLFSENQILFYTPQTLRNDIVKQKYGLFQVCLMIFDEAHHATGDYAYVYLASEYMIQNPEGNILALTASPGATRESVENLCEILHVPLENIHYRSRADADVKSYIKPMDVIKMGVSLTDLMKKALDVIHELIKERLYYLDRLGVIPPSKSDKNSQNIEDKIYRKKLVELRSELVAMTQQGIPSKNVYVALSIIAQALILYHMESLVEQQGLDILLVYLEKLKSEAKKSNSSKAQRYLASNPKLTALLLELKKYQVFKSEMLLHPKLILLKKILAKQFTINPESRVIVFVKLRDSVKNIVEKLKSLPSIQPKRFVGQASKKADKGLSQKEQIKILQDFKDGKYNVLVSTNVGEEGLDIAECDIVIFYDIVASEIRLIQRKGRTARHREGKVIMLYTKDTNDEVYLMVALKKLKHMEGTLKSNAPKTSPSGHLFLLDTTSKDISFTTSVLNSKKKYKIQKTQTRLTSFMNSSCQEIKDQERYVIKNSSLSFSKEFSRILISSRFTVQYGLRKYLQRKKIQYGLNDTISSSDIILLDRILIRIMKPSTMNFHELLLQNKTLQEKYVLVFWAMDFTNYSEHVSGEKIVVKEKIKHFCKSHGIHYLIFDDSQELLFMIHNLYEYNKKKKKKEKI
ncbi:MAG: helicase-related protein [Promethearchaeota archaeon]